MTETKTLLKWNVLNRFSGDRLRELFNYDRETGVFTYLTKASRRTPIGSVAGSVNSEGYREIKVDGISYKAHRLAWLYETGNWPEEFIDHVDGQRDNNRISNLRDATRSQNLANSKVLRLGKSSHKGVRFYADKAKWTARIQYNKKPKFLGYFKTEPEAIAAYSAAADELFGPFAKVAS